MDATSPHIRPPSPHALGTSLSSQWGAEYSATAELSPGELLTVYYQQEQPGEKVCIQATRWSLE